DATDINPGDGVCATSGGGCSLRAAVQEANALPGTDRIFVPAGVYVLSLAGAGEDQAATGDLDLTDSVGIFGAGAVLTVIDGNGTDRIFHVIPPSTGFPQQTNAWIVGMTLRNGRTADLGGALLNALAPGGTGLSETTLYGVVMSGNV